MVFLILGRSLKVIFKQPFRLLGLTAFAGLLAYLSGILFAAVPGVAYVVTALLCAAIAWIYLRTVRGETCKTADFFQVCKDGAVFKRVLTGMAWRDLWILIWGLIPFAGVVFGVMKNYEYRFVPYILMDNPEITASEALKLSSEKTKGYRVKMFLSDLLIFGVCFLVMLSVLPIEFLLIRGNAFGGLVVYSMFSTILLIVLSVFAVLLMNTTHAAYYEEAEHPTPKPERVKPEEPIHNDQPEMNGNYRFCPHCGSKYPAGEAKFCSKCGNPLDE